MKEKRTKWDKDELERVLDLYIEEKNRVHERNPEIVNLAKSLGRTTRSVEAQMLMFRCLERGENYSFKKMGQLVRDVWEKRMADDAQKLKDENMEKGKDNAESQGKTYFPEGLLDWSGHRSGGVKRPFRAGGRPTGDVIETLLLKKLDRWSQELISSTENIPKKLLLVGGPGNGKTDALEYFISLLDTRLEAEGQLEKAFKKEFAINEGGVLPRKVTVQVDNIHKLGAGFIVKQVSVVQDATVNDLLNPEKSSEQLFLEDLIENLDDAGTIYICCINRGILAHALSRLMATDSPPLQCSDLLSNIMEAISMGPESISSWPLENFPQFAVWPMDVESLVDQSVYPEGMSPAHQIFKKALDPEKWVPAEKCPAGEMCPFHTNLEILSSESHLDNLIRILRFYELASGKRWTFRDLFSLVSQVLVGHEEDFVEGNKKFTPCDWAKRQLDYLGSMKDDPRKARARFLLVSKLYQQALFPRWPTLNSEARKLGQLLNGKWSLDANPKDLFRFLRWTPKRQVTSIKSILNKEFGEFLDPVKSPGREVVIMPELSVGMLEEMFSYSIEQAATKVHDHLSTLEKDMLGWLVRTEKKINEGQFPKNLSSACENLKAILKVFACRLVMRSLGTKRGVCKDANYFKEYESALADEGKMNLVRIQLRDLLNKNAQFSISLTTTFGQPVPVESMDAILNVSKIQVKSILNSKKQDKPINPVPHFSVMNQKIPMTFNLYKSFVRISRGMKKSSLPPEILTLLEGTRSILAGEIVRSAEMLDDANIILGDTGETLLIDQGEISVS